MWSLGVRFGVILSVLLTTLLIGVGTAQAQETAALTIDRVGTFDAETGIATISGTYSCGEASGTGLIEVTLQQRVGRVTTVTGFGMFEVVCAPGATGTWSAEVAPTLGSGLFRGGQAFASARLVIEGAAVAETGAPVNLRGGGGSA
jgi:hypothetical protein